MSGQPSEARLAASADLGVAHVVNLALHTHEKALPGEMASVAALGMWYIHIRPPRQAHMPATLRNDASIAPPQ